MLNDEFATSSSTYVPIPGAVIGINVPSGQTRCIRVRFSTSSSCAATNATDHCYIKVLAAYESGAYPFDPVAVFTSIPYASANSFEWISRLGAGAYKIRAQAATNNVAFTLANWTFTVDVAK